VLEAAALTVDREDGVARSRQIALEQLGRSVGETPQVVGEPPNVDAVAVPGPHETMLDPVYVDGGGPQHADLERGVDQMVVVVGHVGAVPVAGEQRRDRVSGIEPGQVDVVGSVAQRLEVRARKSTRMQRSMRHSKTTAYKTP
jgi:hypothetical protein